MPDNTFILKKLPNVSELSLIFITQIIVMNMLATIAILESIFTISYNISDKKRFKIQDYRFIKDFIKDNIYVFQSSAFGIIPMITNPGTYICRLSYIGLSLFIILDNIYNRPSIFEGSFYFRKMFLLKGTF